VRIVVQYCSDWLKPNVAYYRPVAPMAIRTSTLIEFLKTFPDNAIVRGFADGLSVMDADGTGEVVMLNDNFRIPGKTTLSKAGYPVAC
jgi:hypothetical protein